MTLPSTLPSQKLPGQRTRRFPSRASLLLASTLALSAAVPVDTFVHFESAPVHPIALSPDGASLAVCNLPDNRLEVFRLQSDLPQHDGSIPVGLDPVSVRYRTDSEIWVVNHISHSISVVDLATRQVMDTIQTAAGPADVVFAGSPPRAYVSCAWDNLVQIFDPISRQNLDRLDIDGDRPKALAVSPDGHRVYAAIFESGNRSTILSRALTPQDIFPEPGPVDHPDGPYAGQNPPPNAGTAFMPPLHQDLLLGELPVVSHIVKKNAAGRWLDDNEGDWTEFVSGAQAHVSGRCEGWDMPDHDVAVIDADTHQITYATGLMNICMDLAVHPIHGALSVVGTDGSNERRFEPNLRGTFLRVLMATVDPTDLSSGQIDLNPHLEAAPVSLPDSTRARSVGDPRGMVWNQAGTAAYVVGMGSDNLVAIRDDGERVWPDPIALQEGPCGLVFDGSRDRLYVLNRFAGSVSVINAASGNVLGHIPFFDPTPAIIKSGRKHLYNTHRHSSQGQLACGSCHIDARFDRLAWDLGNPASAMLTNEAIATSFHPMKGPLVTQTLQDIIGHEPFHWRGDRPDLRSFQITFTELLGASTLPTDAEMDELQGFLSTIHFPPNRFRNFDNTLSTLVALPGQIGVDAENELDPNTTLPPGNAQAGHALFTERCNGCHNGDSGGNDAVQFLTLNRGNGQPFRIAQLRSLPDKMGMNLLSTNSRSGFGLMHDGRVDSLSRFLTAGFSSGVITNDPTQTTADLIAFLFSFAGGGLQNGRDGDHSARGVPAAVGRQITITLPEAPAILYDMMDQTASPLFPIDLVIRGTLDGLSRSWFLDRNNGYFQSDRNEEDTTLDVLVSLASPAHPLTCTVVPAGTGRRIAADRDVDGYYDQTELDYGWDPADPRSVGTNTPPTLLLSDRHYVHTGSVFELVPGLEDATPSPAGPTFQLVGNSLPGLELDPVTGRIRWFTPPIDGVTYVPLTLRVEDNGFPSLRDTRTITMVLNPPLRIEGLQLTPAHWLRFAWEGLPNLTYRVQFSDDGNRNAWSNTSPDFSFHLPKRYLYTDTSAPGAPHRWYRLLVVP